jgi:hypothetical protein
MNPLLEVRLIQAEVTLPHAAPKFWTGHTVTVFESPESSGDFQSMIGKTLVVFGIQIDIWEQEWEYLVGTPEKGFFEDSWVPERELKAVEFKEG